MIGLRKFSLVLIVILISTGMRIGGWLDADNYANILVWVVGLYMGGNIGESATNKLRVSVRTKHPVG